MILQRAAKAALRRLDWVVPRAFPFLKKLPTFYGGEVVWFPTSSWKTFHSDYEPHVLAALKRSVKQGSVFWDIGANTGWISLFAAKLVGPSGKVFAFEPSPSVFSVLRKNVDELASVKPLRFGVGNADQTATFVAQDGATSASFVEDVTRLNAHYMPDAAIEKVSVEMRRGDTLASEIGEPDVVKIDVEGFELEVLMGMQRVLETRGPDLVVEIHPPQLALTGGEPDDVLNLLSAWGYSLTVIDRNPNSLFTIFARRDIAQAHG